MQLFLERFFEPAQPSDTEGVSSKTQTVTEVKAESADEDFAGGGALKTETVTLVRAEQADEDYDEQAPWLGTPI